MDEEKCVTNPRLYYLDTGCYALNALVSGSLFGGIPSNRVLGLAGEEGVGKTYIFLQLAREFQRRFAKGIVYLNESEGNLRNDDPATMKLLKDWEIDVNRFIIAPVTTVEDFSTEMNRMLDEYLETPEEQRPPMLMGLDSLGMLVTRQLIKQHTEGEHKRDMTKQQVTKGAFATLTHKLNVANIPAIVTNHVYSVIGAYVPTKDMAGGLGLKYAASTIVFLAKKSDKDKATKRVVGANLSAFSFKARGAREKQLIEVHLDFAKGMDRYSHLLKFAELSGVFKKLAKGYELMNGEKAATKAISRHPERYFTQEVLDAIEIWVQKEFRYGSTEIEEEMEDEMEDDLEESDDDSNDN